MSYYCNKNINWGNTGDLNFTEAYSVPSPTSKIEHFHKIVKGWKPVSIVAKSPILDVWIGSDALFWFYEPSLVVLHSPEFKLYPFQAWHPDNCPPRKIASQLVLGFQSRFGLVLWLGSTRQLPGVKLPPG